VRWRLKSAKGDGKYPVASSERSDSFTNKIAYLSRNAIMTARFTFEKDKFFFQK
jgi:hypothetical protein